MALHKGVPVNTEPDRGPIAQPANAAGRVSAYQDFGSRFANRFSISVRWNGRHQAVGFPIACMDLDDPDWGLAFCYEPDLYNGAYVLWAMGRRPDQIRVVKGATGGDHVDGTPMYLEMRVQGDTVTCVADGREVLTSTIPEALRGSSIHGFGLDVNPVPGRPPNVPVIDGPFIIAPLREQP